MKSIVGTFVSSRYRVIKLLGAGAMAIVYLATDDRYDRQVALKVLPSDSPDPDGELLERFQKEFRASARLDHPNIVKLYGSGQLDDGSLYYTMQYIEGPDLAKYLAENGPMAPERALDFVEQMARAFHHFHGSSIVHRDLKPTNIMIADERFVVTDFGLARDLARSQMTKTGTLLGSPLYMSPEQAIGAKVDRRSDIFQLGSIAYEALTGIHPFDGEMLEEVLRNIGRKEHEPITKLRPELNKGWDVLLAHCLAKSPDERYQKAAEIVDDVAALRVGSLTAGCSSARRAKTRQSRKTTAATPIRRLRNRLSDSITMVLQQRNWLLVTMLTLLAMTLLFMLVYFFSNHGTSGFAAKELVCKPGVANVVVTWKSDKPYISRVRVDNRVVENSARGQVTEHRVTVGALEGGKSYKVCVVYPSGETSLSHTIVPEKMNVEVVKATRSKVGMRIVGNCNVRVAALKLQAPDLPIMTVPVTNNGGVWQANVPYFPANTEGITLATVSDNGSSDEISLTDFLSTDCRRLRDSLSSFLPQELLDDVVLNMSPDTSRLVLALQRGHELIEEEKRLFKEKGAKWRPVLQKRFDNSNVQLLELPVRRLAPLLLGTRVLPLRLRSQLYSRLQRIHNFYFASIFCAAKIDYDYNPYGGDFELSSVPLSGYCDELNIFRASDGALKMGIYQKMFGLQSNTQRIEKSFKLSNVSQIEKVQLEFSTQSKFSNIVFKVTVNELDPIFIPDYRRYGKGMRESTDQTRLYQRIPADCLVNGINKVIIEADSLHRKLVRDVIMLEKVTVRLKRVGK